ncbi:MAG: hypothetical protein OET44_15185 [Gammaproteobacteria bacterium]|nr:hypothetical protein [Gammaproteobacteria bacterium]
MKLGHYLLAVCASTAATSLAKAQNSIELRVVAQQEVEVTTDAGIREYRLIPATEVLPGQEVVYTIFFKNVSDLPATDIVIDDPIPAQMYLKAGTVFGSGTDVTYSVDGGKSFDKPGALAVVDQGVAREARPDEYTHIRWVFRETLKPGDQDIVGFRAILR